MFHPLLALFLLEAAVAAGGPAAAEPLPFPVEGRDGPEAISLLGRALVPAAPPSSRQARLQGDLHVALTAWRQAPADEGRTIRLGRRLGYLGRYRDAIDTYSHGLMRHRHSFRLLRHRGHRLISVRRFGDAVEDLSRAARLVHGLPDEVEPDGAPNEHGIPRSTDQSNIWYHLALAHYLQGDFRRALRAQEGGLTVSRANDDMLCAASYWRYLTLRRLGRDREAAEVLEPIAADMEIFENHAYHRLLLAYKVGTREGVEALLEAGAVDGADGIQDATVAYGVGAWFFVEGWRGKAMRIFREILETDSWAAFGYIAAEAEVARAPR